MIARVVALACTLTACGAESTPGNDDAPPTCDAPHAGVYEAPALPEGAGCWEARAASSALVLTDRDRPELCGHCSCLAIGSVHPGALIDAWGTPVDPRVVVSFVPQPAEYCLE